MAYAAPKCIYRSATIGVFQLTGSTVDITNIPAEEPTADPHVQRTRDTLKQLECEFIATAPIDVSMAEEVINIGDLCDSGELQRQATDLWGESAATPVVAPAAVVATHHQGWRRDTIRLSHVPQRQDSDQSIHEPVRRRDNPTLVVPPRSVRSVRSVRSNTPQAPRNASQAAARANPDRLLRRGALHRAPEATTTRYLMGVSGASSIITPRYQCVDECNIKSPSAEELNEVFKRGSRIEPPVESHSPAYSAPAYSAPAYSAPAYSAPAVPQEQSNERLAAISVTVIPSVKPGVVSVDDAPPTQARAVNRPLSALAGRFTKVNLSAVSVNVDTGGVYESSLSAPDRNDFIFESHHPMDGLLPLGCDYREHMCDGATNNGTHHGGVHVAVSLTAMLALNTVRLAGSCPKLSPAFLYYNRRTRPVHGMSARDALRTLLKVGVAESESYPWDGDDYFAPVITESSYRTARRHRIAFYAAIVSTQGLKCALNITGACWILLPLFSMRPRFWCTNNHDTRGRVIGVQSAVVVGYAEDGFILTVWDSNWIGDRTMILPYTDWDSVIECWAAPVSRESLVAGDYIGSMIVPRGVGTSPVICAAADTAADTAAADIATAPDKKDVISNAHNGCVIL